MTDPGIHDPDLIKVVNDNLITLLDIKTRLPFLRALAKELVRVGLGKPIRNDILLRVVNDSFDVLVIDLASLREGMTKGDQGIFSRLREDPSSLRRFAPEEFDPKVHLVAGADEGVRDVIAEHVRRQIADGLNAALDRLFPEGPPVTETHVNGLITRFRKDTEPTDRDRNRARAHRHERSFDLTHRQDLDQVEQQVKVFDRYLSDLYLILTKSQHHMHLETEANVEDAANDMADLLIHGSINYATLEFGVVRRDPPEQDRYYWLRRREYYARETASSDVAVPRTNL